MTEKKFLDHEHLLFFLSVSGKRVAFTENIKINKKYFRSEMQKIMADGKMDDWFSIPRAPW